MQSFATILPILCCALFGIISASGFNNSPKIFEVNGFGPCPEQNELLMQFNITEKALPQRSKFSLNGTILVLEQISGPIELHFRTQRCALDMTHCEDFGTSILPEICSRLREKNVLWSDLIGSIRPKFDCPFQKGTYTVNNATVDLSMLSRLPIDGYTWMAYMHLFKQKNRKKKSILCARFEVAVSTAKGSLPHHN